MTEQGTLSRSPVKPGLERLGRVGERPIRFEAVRQDELMTPGYYLMLLRQHHLSARRKWSRGELEAEV